jgi:regulator of cell morphogenesis and NO signaling
MNTTHSCCGHAALAGAELPVAAKWHQWTLTELMDHIVGVHHAYLRRELPRLDGVVQALRGSAPCETALLADLRDTLAQLTSELMQHMLKEENVLFPWIRQLEAGGAASGGHCATIAMPIQVMEHEHAEATDALSRLCRLSREYACVSPSDPSRQSLCDDFAALDNDLHAHIYKENDVLFPRALALESAAQSA